MKSQIALRAKSLTKFAFRLLKEEQSNGPKRHYYILIAAHDLTPLESITEQLKHRKRIADKEVGGVTNADLKWLQKQIAKGEQFRESVIRDFLEGAEYGHLTRLFKRRRLSKAGALAGTKEQVQKAFARLLGSGRTEPSFDCYKRDKELLLVCIFYPQPVYYTILG
jgi:hypothetical protein